MVSFQGICRFIPKPWLVPASFGQAPEHVVAGWLLAGSIVNLQINLWIRRKSENGSPWEFVATPPRMSEVELSLLTAYVEWTNLLLSPCLLGTGT